MHGNRIFSFDPAAEEFEVFVMPTSYSGPRRPDVGADGILWIPEYSGDKLTRFDPATKQQFTDWLLSEEGQQAIADFKLNGQQLFFPNAPATN